MKNKKKLELELKIEHNDNSKEFIIKKGNNSFSFSLSDETFSNLDLFINFLLNNIKNYDSLNIEIMNHDNLSDFDKELSEGFKKIWEDEFDEIIRELEEFEEGDQ